MTYKRKDGGENFKPKSSLTEIGKKLVEDNLGLAASAVKRYSGSPNYNDLLSEANLGLVIAAATWNKDFGVAFSTYAFHCIRNAIIKFLRREMQYKSVSLDYNLQEIESGRQGEQTVDDLDEIDFINNNISDREVNILKMRSDGSTLLEIGAAHGISKQRVQQITKRIKEKAR